MRPNDANPLDRMICYRYGSDMVGIRRQRQHILDLSAVLLGLMLAGAILSGCADPIAESSVQWATLAPGLDFGTFDATKRSPVGDSRITVLRIDPKLWEFVLLGKSWTGETENQTAEQWCKKYGLTAAINAGMFATNEATHVGHLQTRGYTNSATVSKYMSVAAFHPRRDTLPEYRLFDLDEPGVTVDTIRDDFASVVQNLRLIKKTGENRWRQQDKIWSEAALGEDNAGRALFIFSRSPFSMHDLNQQLLSMGIGLIAAQHLEGGPEAQLYARVGQRTLEMVGSYETEFREDDGNTNAWPVPNIIGIRPRQ
jgi:hypothetical protein